MSFFQSDLVGSGDGLMGNPSRVDPCTPRHIGLHMSIPFVCVKMIFLKKCLLNMSKAPHNLTNEFTLNKSTFCALNELQFHNHSNAFLCQTLRMCLDYRFVEKFARESE